MAATKHTPGRAVFEQLPTFKRGDKYADLYRVTGAKTGRAYTVKRKHWVLPTSTWGWQATRDDGKTVYGDTLAELAYELGYTEGAAIAKARGR